MNIDITVSQLRAVQSLYNWSRSLVQITGSKSVSGACWTSAALWCHFCSEVLSTEYPGIGRGRSESFFAQSLDIFAFYLCFFASSGFIKCPHVLWQVCS